MASTTLATHRLPALNRDIGSRFGIDERFPFYESQWGCFFRMSSSVVASESLNFGR